MSAQIKSEIIEWIVSGSDYSAGVQLYNKYGTNVILKKTVFIPGRNFPSILARLKKELCAIADIPFDPLRPDDLKKKSKPLYSPVEEPPQISPPTPPKKKPQPALKLTKTSDKRKKNSSDSSRKTPTKSPKISKS